MAMWLPKDVLPDRLDSDRVTGLYRKAQTDRQTDRQTDTHTHTHTHTQLHLKIRSL